MKITNSYEDLEQVKNKIKSQLVFREPILFLL